MALAVDESHLEIVVTDIGPLTRFECHPLQLDCRSLHGQHEDVVTNLLEIHVHGCRDEVPRHARPLFEVGDEEHAPVDTSVALIVVARRVLEVVCRDVMPRLEIGRDIYGNSSHGKFLPVCRTCLAVREILMRGKAGATALLCQGASEDFPQ